MDIPFPDSIETITCPQEIISDSISSTRARLQVNDHCRKVYVAAHDIPNEAPNGDNRIFRLLDLMAMRNPKVTYIVAALPLLILTLSVNVSSSFNITVQTNKPSYQTGETIEAYGNLTHDGLPMTGLVGFRLINPSNDTVLQRALQTDAFGAFNTTFRLAQGMELGTYVIHVTSFVGEETVSCNTTFDLMEDPDSNSFHGGGGGRIPYVD